MYRFFVPPEWLGPQQAEIGAPVARQIATVLRLTPGDRVCLLDDSGWEIEVELGEVRTDRIAAVVVRRSLATSEPRLKVTVYQGLLKGDKFEWVLQKCTELGAMAFVPLLTARTVVGAVGEADSQRWRRWQRIIQEAAEQCQRGRLPALRVAQLFAAACEGAGGALSLIPWEGEKERSLRAALRQSLDGAPGRRPFTVNLFIGPEGGFTESEVKLARRHGIIPVSLGRRVLRAETAAVVATAAVLHEAGDMDP
ncbi:MAG: 16S rRNA (uracil(1498)-N(3))-methyltransferase [Chloroflexi bacterium]|nr:16S rRNA (uracil(1498)-N(3))-methyltransferase [Chloroflexota bacterium]